jgi:hypothetical protein
MKKVVLIGDSIRMGYDKYVRAALDGKAEVLFPEENSRFAEYVLRTVIDWKNNGKWGDDVDVVHWNAGLWDSLTLFEDGIFTPVDVYKDTIKRIDKRIRLLFPEAKVIFATSTRVIEERFPEPNVSIRRNADTEMLNAAAIEALKDTDTVINDLYTLTANAPIEYYSDMTHLYTKEGTELIGNKVINCIESVLGEKFHFKNTGTSVAENPIGL